MYDYYAVKWTLTNELIAARPSDPEAIVKMLEQKGREDLAEEVINGVGGAPEEPSKASHLVFQHNEGGLCMGGYTVKAHLKEAARILSPFMMTADGKKRIANYRFKFANHCYVLDDVIPIMRDGSQVVDPDGVEIRTATVMTRKGPESIVKQHDYVLGAELQFTLRALRNVTPDEDIVSLQRLNVLMEYGSIHGYAGERSMGHGRYTHDMALIDEPTAVPA